VDLFVGMILSGLAFKLGYGWNSLLMVLVVFLPDLDIPWNEFWRIFIKREKKFQFVTLLDEYSYTHRFWFHNPLVFLPIIFLLMHWYLDWVFGVLVVLGILCHFIHDTTDHSFCGVRWLWPFSSKSFRLQHSSFGWSVTSLSRQDLLNRANQLAQNSRSTKEILRDCK